MFHAEAFSGNMSPHGSYIEGRQPKVQIVFSIFDMEIRVTRLNSTCSLSESREAQY